MRFVPILLALGLCLATFSLNAAETVRPWTSQKGAILRATLIGFDGETAYLKPQAEGEKIVPIKYAALSFEDQDYIDRRRHVLPGAPAGEGGVLDTIARDWTSTNGKVVTAVLVNVDGDFAVLEREGKIYRVPIYNLSAAEQTYIQSKMPDKPAVPVKGVNPDRVWNFKDGTFDAMRLIGFREVDLSVKFAKDRKAVYVAFGDLTPNDQVLAYRWLEGQGHKVSKLKPEGDMTQGMEETDPADEFLPGMPKLPPIPKRTKWTRASDGMESTAALLRVNGYFVDLERNGQIMTLPIYRLSLDDQEYLAKYWGYSGPIGNTPPKQRDGMTVDLGNWSVSPGEMVDVTRLTPEQLEQMFPAGGNELEASPTDQSDPRDDATLGEDPAPAATVTTPEPERQPTPEELMEDWDDDDEWDDDEDSEDGPFMLAMRGLQALLFLIAAGFGVFTGIKAKKDGMVWLAGCIGTSVLGLILTLPSVIILGHWLVLLFMFIAVSAPLAYCKQNQEAMKLPMLGLTACEFVTIVIYFITP
jgi:hypothetical protein